MSELRVLLVTCTEAEAADLVRTLVEERLVACGNITAGVRSLYRWQGEVCDETEALLVMETTAARLPETTARLRALHSYAVPKILAIEPTDVDDDYLAWVVEQTTPG